MKNPKLDISTPRPIRKTDRKEAPTWYGVGPPREPVTPGLRRSAPVNVNAIGFVHKYPNEESE